MSTPHHAPPNAQLLVGSWRVGSWKWSRPFQVSADIVREATTGLARNRVRAGLSMLNEGQSVSYDVIEERGKQAAGNLQTV